VHPEEMEAMINRHPGVRMSLVKARKSPIIGTLVVADIVVNSTARSSGAAPGLGAVKDSIIRACRQALERHKVLASIRIVPALEIAASGKLARLYA
jgi:acyl-coenzyme A synthetase/AMP-(fatty) acid ligase